MWSQSDDAKAKITAYRTGKKHTPETIHKIRVGRLSKVPPSKRHKSNLERSVLQRLMALVEMPSEERKVWLELFNEQQQNLDDLNQKLSQKGLTRSVKNLGKKHPKKGRKGLTQRILLSNIYNINIRDFINNNNSVIRIQLDLVQKAVNLNVSLSQLVEAQKAAVLQAKKDIRSSNPIQRFKYNQSIKAIARIYTDSARRLVGGRPINLFNRFKPMWEQKNFFFLLKLKVIFDIVGVNTDTDRRQYIQGVFDQKRIKNKRDFIPLKVLSSPLCFLDYLFYLKTNWYLRFPTQDLDKDRALRESRYGSTYYEEQMKFALGICGQLISIGGKSRLEMEIPHAFGSTDFCLFYCWCSPFIPKLRKLGVLRSGWPEVHKGMTKLKRRAKEDPELREAVRNTKKLIEEMWAKSDFPKHSEEPYEDIRGIIEHVCPQHEEDVRHWLLTLKT